MAILTRQTQKVFASSANADQIAVFGSMKTGTPVYSSDLATLQSNAYLQGWSDAILNDKAPYLEEMNAVQYGLSYQIAYLLQEGIPAYDANTNYSATSIVKVINNNELELYHSLSDDNLGNALTDTNYWARVYFTNTSIIGQPQFTLDFSTLPDNCVWLEGSLDGIPGSSNTCYYPNLYALYGTNYNRGDEATGYYRLPDFRNVTIWGGTTAGYITAGLPNIKAEFAIDNRRWLTGAVYSSGSSNTGATGESGQQFHAYLDASTYNSIYSDAVSTVQPPSIKVRVYTRYQ